MKASVEKYIPFRGLGQEDEYDEDDIPTFATKPADLKLSEYSTAHFECRLDPADDESMRIEWFHNGKPVQTGSRVKTVNDFGIVILEVGRVEVCDSGYYTCRASNECGEASVTCKLDVQGRQEPQEMSDSILKLEEALYGREEVVREEEQPKSEPVFTVGLKDALDVPEAEPAHFECRVEPTDDSSLRIDWFFNGRPFATGSRVRTISDFGFISLDMDYVYPRDSGEYMCRATNKWGTATTKARLTCKAKKGIILDSQLPDGIDNEKFRALEEHEPVPERVEKEKPRVPPEFLSDIESTTVDESKVVHFEARVEPKDDANLKVEWFKDGKPLATGSRYKSVFEFGFVSLDIAQFYPEDSGVYVCRATNDFGVAETKATATCRTLRGRGRRATRLH